MNVRNAINVQEEAMMAEEQTGAGWAPPLAQPSLTMPSHAALPVGVVIGELLAIKDEGRTPLVIFPGQHNTAAVPARTVVDLHGCHIGRQVVLTFEWGDPDNPIVMGVLRQCEGWPLADQPGEVEVDVDGERLVVSAKVQLVLRCGSASITLTQAGKILIKGNFVASYATGTNRVKGGSVQIN